MQTVCRKVVKGRKSGMKTCFLQEKRHTIDVDNMPKGGEGETKWYENMLFTGETAH